MSRDKEKLLSLFRGRDLILLFVAAVAFYGALDGSSNFQYSLSPSWYINTRETSSRLHQQFHSPENHLNSRELLVPPVIGDLDGDGLNELVIITADFELQILSTDQSTSEVYQPEVLALKTLSDINVHHGKYPVALQIGYVDEYTTSHSRNQVIIVVTEDFTVSCYDHLLTLLWEKSISHNSNDIDKNILLFKLQEIAIFPSPFSVRNSTSGSVFIGFSMKLRDSLSNKEHVRNEDGMFLDEKEHIDMNVRSKLEHFSVYALDAMNGHVLWRHNGMEVKVEQYTKSLPKSSMFRLELEDLMMKTHHSTGHVMNDWTLFRESLTAQLPHEWHGSEDTYFDIAKFSRRHIGSKANEDTVINKESIAKRQSKFDSKPSGRFIGVNFDSVPLSAKLPHGSYEHIAHPNVLVAHTSKGLEVISLSTGVPITSLALSTEKTYADIDGDSVVDTVLLFESASLAASYGAEYADPGREFKHCTFTVISGLPAKSQMFNGTICHGSNSLQDPMTRRRETSMMPREVSAASPVIIRKVDARSAQESKVRDVIIAVNTGVVTSYSGAGQFQWQVKNGPKWELDYKPSAVLFDIDAERVTDVGSHDSLGAHLLICGHDSMTVYSSDGTLLTTIALSSPPIGKPVLADFDSDGISDIIIMTKDAILGYRLEVLQSTSGLLIAVVILLFMTMLVFVANIKTHESFATGNRKFLTIIRSTDNLHVD